MSLREDLSALPREAWILFAGTFINRFGSFVHPFLVLYLTSRGYSAAIAGVAMAAYGGGHFVAAFVGGYLADRIGRRRAIALSMFSSAAAMLALATAENLASIIALSAAAGLASEVYRPAASALLTDLTTEGKRVVAFGAYRLAVNAGFATGPAIAGFVATKSFTWLFFGDAITSVIYGVIALTTLPDGASHHGEQASWIPAMRTASHDKAFVRVLIASIFTSCVFFQFESTLPLHIVNLGFSTTVYGFLISCNGVMIIFCELPLASYLQRFHATRAMATGFIFTGVGFGLTGFAGTLPLLVATTMLWTIGEMVFAPVAGGYVADLAPVAMRGRYMGLWQFTWAIGLTLGPAGGVLLYSWNPSVLWLACLLSGVLAAIIIGLGSSSMVRDTGN